LTSDTHGVSRSVERAAADPATWAVETTMFRALAVLRFVVLVFAITTTLVKWDGLERPGVAGFALAVMTGWTGFTTWAYDEPRRRRPPLLVADLVIAVVMVLLTVVVQSDAQLTGNLSTLPSFWVMAVVLAWGIHWHWVGGLIASAAVSVADIAIRPEITQTNVGNIFLLMVGGPVIGYTTGLLKEMAGARDRAERAAAAAAERARLARVVHDGVLQVLSLVQRRGLELGGEAAELGRLAGEQEVALRALVQGWAGAPSTDLGDRDLVAGLAGLGSRTVTVSGPGAAIRLPSAVVDEVTSVVRACLDNVARHVGDDAPAWVLVEDLGESVVVTVRDEGPGIPDGRLDAARSEGRLGVSESICGRMRDLGGSASLVTAPGQGTEWELTLPRR
jgi:signal transduction histidine kinase